MQFFSVYSPKSTNGESEYIHAPLHVRSCGHYAIKGYFRDNPFKKNFFELFWGIRGAIQIRHQEKTFLLQEKKIFCYLPGDFHDIISCITPLEYCWLTLDGPNVASVIEQFQFKRELRTVAPCPVHLFSQLGEQMRKFTIEGEYWASSIAYQILTMAALGAMPGKNLFDRFEEFIAENYMNPALDMPMIANALGVHRSTLNRCVFQLCGITPGEYIHAFRMQEVFQLVRSSTLSVKEIALKAGYSDPGYFTKVVRRHFGVAPSALRNTNRRPEISRSKGNSHLYTEKNKKQQEK